MAVGDISIYREATGGESISGGVNPMDTTVVEETGSFDGTSWTADEVGRYLAFGGFVGTQNSGTNARTEVYAGLQHSAFGINFRDGDFGTRTLATQLNKLICNCAGIYGMLVGQTINLYAAVSGNSSPSNVTRDANRNYLGVIKLDDDWDYLQLRTTDESPSATSSFQVLDTWNVGDEVDSAFDWADGDDAEWVSFTELGWYWLFISLHARHDNPGGSNVTCVAILEEDENGDEVTITERARVTCFLDGRDGCDDGYLNFKIPIDNADVDARFRIRFATDGSPTDSFYISPGGTVWSACKLGREDIDYATGVMTADDTSAPNDLDRLNFDTWTVDEGSSTADSFLSLGSPSRELEITHDAYTLAFFQFNISRPSTSATGAEFNYRMFVRNTIVGPQYGDQKVYSNNDSTTTGNQGGSHGLVVFLADSTEDYGLHNFRNTSSTDSTLQIDQDFTSIQFFAIGTVLPQIHQVDEPVDVVDSNILLREFVKQIDETVHIEEALINQLGLVRQVDEEVHIVDSVLYGRGRLALVDEEVHVDEDVIVALELVRVLEDEVHIDENVLVLRDMVRQVDEECHVVDAVIRHRDRLIEVQEILEIRDGNVLTFLTTIGDELTVVVDEIVEVQDAEAITASVLSIFLRKKGRVARGGGEAGHIRGTRT